MKTLSQTTRDSQTSPRSGPSFGKTVKQLSKFAACLIGTTAMCLSAYSLIVDSLVPNSEIPATYKWFLLKEVPGPRIIFESGSNSHHSIDTETVGNELGMTAINIGDNAGYALEDKISRLETFARPGDVIVLPLEWSFYSREKLTDAYVESIFSETRDYYRTLPLHKRVSRALSLPPEKVIAEFQDSFSRATQETESPAQELFGTALTLPSGHFARTASIGPGFGVAEQSCDDYILGKPNVRNKLTLGKNIKPALARLKKLQARGIKIHFAWPVLTGEGCMNDLAYVKGFKNEIEKAVKEAGFEFLGTPSQSLYGQNMQDDTPYHLIAEGTKIHTQQMVKFLKAQGHGSSGAPLDIKTFARHRLLELELADVKPLKQPAFPLGQEIRMEDPEFRGHAEFTAGWWAFEPYGRWMRDNRAMFRVTLPENTAEDSVLNIQGITKSGRMERVNVTINGELIHSAMFGANTPLRVPTANLPKGEALSIFLTLPDAGTPQSPFDGGESEDARSMTLLLQSLELTAPNPAKLEPAQDVKMPPAQSASALKITPAMSALAMLNSAQDVSDSCIIISDSKSPKSSAIIFQEGWWEPEPSGRWMKGGQANFKINIADRQSAENNRQYMLTLQGDFFMDRSQALSFMVDGTQMGELKDAGQGRMTALFKAPKESRDLNIKLILPTPSEQSPRALGLSDDERKLTYFLKSVTVTDA